MLFSQRKGLKPLAKHIQKEAVDDELRYGLWNCLHAIYLERWNGAYNLLAGSNLEPLFVEYWHTFYKRPIDNLDRGDFREAVQTIRDWFLKCEWQEVYDFLEFTIKNGPEWFAAGFRDMTNGVLERESSAYRFVSDEITEITSDEEIEAIEAAFAGTSRFSGAQAHLRQALQHLSDRRNPDHRNSIKESISAVEALCQVITNDPHATLGKALQRLEPTVALHPALREAFSKLYGYTSNADGIRHAMLDESHLTFSDAKFMLVACSGFINFVIGKCAEKGIEVGG